MAIGWKSIGRCRPIPRSCADSERAAGKTDSSLALDLEPGLDPVRTLANDAVQPDAIAHLAHAQFEEVVGGEIVGAHDDGVQLAIGVDARHVERGRAFL